MNDSTSPILSPYNRNGITVRNRIAVAPMTRITATEHGQPKPCSTTTSDSRKVASGW
ncbi:2,4-dienoyl-CoA reductase-like NADH-dependent reductase (Old Yellow Enzyme family) [Paraburkholderia strydomiana]|nr:2,4-dienoyl-CoA reductase-like NADH-dependent reductase (Old Yellow Enzyme family) [Paraburkholderia strydomiana]